jgi:hypothetical protein
MKFFGTALFALASGAAAFTPATSGNGKSTALFSAPPPPGAGPGGPGPGLAPPQVVRRSAAR